MTTRRQFLQSATTALAAAALARRLPAQPGTAPLAHTTRPIELQLYTVRSQAQHDLPALLKEIRSIGYDEVETYWDIYTHPAAELRSMIADAGLRVPSGHFDYEGLDGKFDYAKALGVEYMVCPMLPKAQQNSLDGFARAADQFNRWGERARSAGLQFAFHNHNYEFQRFGTTTGFELLMARTEASLVALEMDCYWITQAGLDPVTMMKKYAGRVRMLHIKDRSAGFAPSQQLNPAAEHFTEVGTGTIAWPAILAAARQQKIAHLFVEQDTIAGDPLASIRTSYRDLARLLA